MLAPVIYWKRYFIKYNLNFMLVSELAESLLLHIPPHRNGSESLHCEFEVN